MSLPRRELFDVCRKEKTISAKNSAAFSYVCNKLGLDREIEDTIKRQINNLNSKISKKWTESRRSIHVMLARESKWLDENVAFFPQHQSAESMPGPSSSKMGRPPKVCKSDCRKVCGSIPVV